MDENHRTWYWTNFESICFRHKRDAFQEFFATIMERRYPGDFHRTRPGGPLGDRACDGYLESSKTVFQVYAPRNTKPGELHAKMKSDFATAQIFFKKAMRKWVFVHNDTELLSDTLRLINELQSASPDVETSFWNMKEIWKRVESLPTQDLDELLKPYPGSNVSLDELSDPMKAEMRAGSPEFQPSAPSPYSSRRDIASPARSRVLAEQVDAQAAEIRGFLDKEGQQRWDAVKQQMAEMSFSQAIAAAKKLEAWLKEKGTAASPEVRGRAYVLLADVAVIEGSDSATLEGTAMGDARRYYERARDAFGAQISQEDAERLVSLGAKLDAVEGNYEKALHETESYEGPGILALRLALLIERRRIVAAAKLVRDRELHPRWCDCAVIIHVEDEHDEKARQVIDWAKGKDEITYHRCLFSFARAKVVRVQNELGHRVSSLPVQLELRQEQDLTEALSALQPILSGPRDTGHVRAGLQAESLGIAITGAYLLGDFDRCRTYCRLLQKYEPVHLTIARAVQAGIIESPEDLPDRLRCDHPSSPEALRLAASIEGICLNKLEKALAGVREMIKVEKSVEEKERLCELLTELAGALGASRQKEIDSFLSVQLGADHRLARLYHVSILLHERSTVEASRIIDDLRSDNDPLWWQLFANLKYLQNDKPAAAEAMATAASMLPRIEVLRSAAALADQAGRSDLLDSLLKQILLLAPDDECAAFRLGITYSQRHRYAEAASCFKRLWERRPDESAFGLNLAACLRGDGRPQEALAILEQVSQITPPILRAILSRAQLLRELGSPDRAFQILKPFAGDFWDQEDFLLPYVGFGYAAGDDDASDRAFQRLIELKHEGKVSPEKFRSASIEDTVDWIRQHHDNLCSASEAVLKGELPWLGAELVRRVPPYLGWEYRTQDLTVSDSTEARSTFAVFSTNSFTVRKTGSHGPWFEQIVCTPRGSEIVIDLTALMTVHRLGLLPQVTWYFGTLHVPSVYIPWLADDTPNLMAHQRSTVEALQAVADALDAGSIQVLADSPIPPKSEVPAIMEYSDQQPAETGSYHLIDLLSWLHSSQQISDSEYQRAQRVAHNAPRSDLPPLDTRAGNGVFTDMQTLGAISRVALLDRVLRSTMVYLTQKESAQVRTELRIAARRRDVLAWHEDLAATLADKVKFKRIAATSPDDQENTEEGSVGERPLAALEIALNRRLPLFADDRVCQAIALNTRKDDAFASFGTDAFLTALLKNTTIPLSQVARHFVQLLRWRYRFLVVPSAVLVHLAFDYQSHPPGPALSQVAQYVQDCMRDPGLFGGREATHPPLPLAVQFCHSWIAVLAELIMNVWLDNRFEDNIAEALTAWALNECLPRSPRNLHPHLQHNMAQALPHVLIGHLLTRTITTKNEPRANRALQAVKDVLALPDREYIRLVRDVTNVEHRR